MKKDRNASSAGEQPNRSRKQRHLLPPHLCLALIVLGFQVTRGPSKIREIKSMDRERQGEVRQKTKPLQHRVENTL